MKKVRDFLQKLRFGNGKIARQIYMIYVLVLLIPLSALGILLLTSGRQMLVDHSIELLEADNSRVKTLISEVTTQTRTISDEICMDSGLKYLLTGEYATYSEYITEANAYTKLDELVFHYLELDRIRIYSTNPSIKDYKQFRIVTQEVEEADWYQNALNTSVPFWYAISEDSYSTNLSNLCLVRQIVLPDSDARAVLVIRVSDSYIRSRIDSGSVVDVISVDDLGIVYSSRRGWYSQPQPLEIDHSESYFRFSGETEVDGTACYAAVSTLHPNRTPSKLYIGTLDSSGPVATRRIVGGWLMLLLAALLVPGAILTMFTSHFSRRVLLLRTQMHQASSQNYNIIDTFGGNDELTEAFEDLKVMVRDIKEKDAKMYEAELKEQELQNKQQTMEYKMLASQINPHYLYNTLETIRMKALTSGCKEVADSVKLLGKTLHYVQENTGTAFTTLGKELENVENYLAIQKLRFSSRINYTRTIQEGLNAESYTMLPLMLQPVVENAVVHGLEVVDGTGNIHIDVREEEGNLCISVMDNGNGIAPRELAAVRQMLSDPKLNAGGSVALCNTQRRIQLCYGDAYGIQIDSEPGRGTCVRLVLPAEYTKNDS